MSTEPKMIADLRLPNDKLDTLKFAYCLFGKFAYGWHFDPAIIPVAHVLPLLERYAQWRAQNQADPKPMSLLYFELSGNEPVIRVAPERVEKAKVEKPYVPVGYIGHVSRDKSSLAPALAKIVSGEIDYSAAIGEMMEDAK